MPRQYMSPHTNTVEHAQRNLTLPFNFIGAWPRTKDFKPHSLHQADYYSVLLQFLFQSGIESQGHTGLQFHFLIVYFHQHKLESLLQEKKIGA